MSIERRIEALEAALGGDRLSPEERARLEVLTQRLRDSGGWDGLRKEDPEAVRELLSLMIREAGPEGWVAAVMQVWERRKAAS